MEAPSNIRTKAYVVESKGSPFTLRDVVLDEVQPSEVLVEIWYTGICHTDVVVQHGGMPLGSYPAVLGHEGAGVVRFCLEGSCGTCPHMTETNFIRPARRGAGAKSPISLSDGTTVHGQFFGQSSMSRLAIVAEESVVKVDARPEELRALPPLGCGYLTGAGTVFNAVKPQAQDTVAIVGMGAVGIAAMLAAKSLGVRQVVAVDVVDTKLQLASSLGATHTINSVVEPDLPAALHALIPGGPDKIIDTTGVAGVLEASVKALAHGGTLALVGVPSPTATLKINALDLLLSCKRVIGVIEGASNPHTIIPRLFQLHRDGKFPVDSLARFYPAEQLDQAIADLESGRIVKPILSWEGFN
ncbi:alcohol dehydrogenase [Trichoderma arundinaceum]|uniref:Alcohol dehydrogenase n=1 Tax=Trichoderma arundinaceum TaxID=490622 RepID=A0A395NEN6_TRIAR|nr:alcohol dehydrogenase [Trichoderma arundinaceum]